MQGGHWGRRGFTGILERQQERPAACTMSPLCTPRSAIKAPPAAHSQPPFPTFPPLAGTTPCRPPRGQKLQPAGCISSKGSKTQRSGTAASRAGVRRTGVCAAGWSYVVSGVWVGPGLQQAPGGLQPPVGSRQMQRRAAILQAAAAELVMSTRCLPCEPTARCAR